MLGRVLLDLIVLAALSQNLYQLGAARATPAALYAVVVLVIPFLLGVGAAEKRSFVSSWFSLHSFVRSAVSVLSVSVFFLLSASGRPLASVIWAGLFVTAAIVYSVGLLAGYIGRFFWALLGILLALFIAFWFLHLRL